MIDVLDIIALVVIAVLLAAVVAIVVGLGSLPGAIARKRGHPQAAAVNVASWLGIATLGLLWPLAFIWAFYKTFGRRGPRLIGLIVWAIQAATWGSPIVIMYNLRANDAVRARPKAARNSTWSAMDRSGFRGPIVELFFDRQSLGRAPTVCSGQGDGPGASSRELQVCARLAVAARMRVPYDRRTRPA
jgi:hypothetical protein